MDARSQLVSPDVIVVETITHAVAHFYETPYTDNSLLFIENFQDAGYDLEVTKINYVIRNQLRLSYSGSWV